MPSPGSEDTHKVAPRQIPSNIPPSDVPPAIDDKNVLGPNTNQSSETRIETPSEAAGQGASDVKTIPTIPNSQQDPSVTEVIESEASADAQEASTEESKQHRKPYKKKAPTERPSPPPQRRPVTDLSRRKRSTFLGGTRRGRNKTSSANTPGPQESRTNEVDQASDAEENLNIQSPFIEISLNGVVVNLVFPEQVVKMDGAELPVQLLYTVESNGEARQVTASMQRRNDGTAVIQRTETLLHNPPETLRVSYPRVLDDKTFEYKHVNTSFYLFRAIGNDQGRMFWLFDERGNPNPLPKRNFWLLIHEDFELEEPSPTLIDEQWVWNHYKPCLIDLAQTNVLRIRSKTSQRIVALGAERSFQIEGEMLIQDDFRNESSLFCGRAVTIRAPHTNEQGWTVWISTKGHAARLWRTDWTGEEPVILDCPDNLPARFGEFQIDICPTGSRIAEETLFFRWFPWLAIDLRRELVFPGPHKGHSLAEIRVRLTESGRWKVSSEKKYPVRSIDSAYLFDLPPENDSIRMTISERSSTEPTITLRLTSPRVKWRTSDTLSWYSGALTVKRDQLVTGEQVNLIVRTNDLFSAYHLTAVLCTGNQQLQTERMVKNGLDYIIALNRFFDTIAANPDELHISVEIRNDDGDKKLLGTIKTVVVGQKTIEKETRSESHPGKKRILKQVYQAKVKCSGNTHKRRPGKGFSKKEIESAGLALPRIRRSKLVPIDKRRKSCHQWNVETLLTVKADQKPER